MLQRTVGFLVVILIAFASTAMCSINSNTEVVWQDKKNIAENVNAKKFKFLIEHKEGVILDVRTVDEVAQGFIKGALNIDYYSKVFKSELTKLDKSNPVFVYCKSGGRSSKAMAIMVDMGFVEVYNLIGGYSGWPYK